MLTFLRGTHSAKHLLIHMNAFVHRLFRRVIRNDLEEVEYDAGIGRNEARFI